MKGFSIVVAHGLIVVSCVAIGAWLVANGHPWFGLLAMLIGGFQHTTIR